MDLHLPILIIIVHVLVILLIVVFLFYYFKLLRIHKTKHHLESLFDTIDDPLAVIDVDYNLCRVNRAYADMLETTFNFVLGKKCYTILRGRESPCDDCCIKSVIAKASNAYVDNSPFPGDKNRTLSLRFYPFEYDNTSNCYSIIEHIREITKIEKLQSDLKKRNAILTDTTTVLREAQKNVNKELGLARKVQRNFLPHVSPVFSGLEIFHSYHPIMEVGGDLYDFIKLGKNKLGIFIGDVSGHGISAALISAISKMSLYQHSKSKIPSNNMMIKLNNDLIKNVRTDHFLTAFWGIFDVRDNSFTYSRAGHPLPIVVRKNGEVNVLNAHGTFLGVLDNLFFEQKKFYFRKGDRCILVTDGIYEVQSFEDNLDQIIGFRQFKKIVEKIADYSIDEVIPYIEKCFSKYKYEDDYTIIAFEVTTDAKSDISEKLPGFVYTDEISFFTFVTMADIDNYRQFLTRELEFMDFPLETIKESEEVVIKTIAYVIGISNEKNMENIVKVAHSITKEELKVCIAGKNVNFNNDNRFLNVGKINSSGNALTYKIFRK